MLRTADLEVEFSACTSSFPGGVGETPPRAELQPHVPRPHSVVLDISLESNPVHAVHAAMLLCSSRSPFFLGQQPQAQPPESGSGFPCWDLHDSRVADVFTSCCWWAMYSRNSIRAFPSDSPLTGGARFYRKDPTSLVPWKLIALKSG